ncbi:Hypothetical predicted protein, partial [Marmota monax]
FSATGEGHALKTVGEYLLLAFQGIHPSSVLMARVLSAGWAWLFTVSLLAYRTGGTSSRNT